LKSWHKVYNKIRLSVKALGEGDERVRGWESRKRWNAPRRVVICRLPSAIRSAVITRRENPDGRGRKNDDNGRRTLPWSEMRFACSPPPPPGKKMCSFFFSFFFFSGWGMCQAAGVTGEAPEVTLQTRSQYNDRLQRSETRPTRRHRHPTAVWRRNRREFWNSRWGGGRGGSLSPWRQRDGRSSEAATRNDIC